jgi:hypothetical protein
MKHSRIRIYDNGGKTVDRYTFVFPSLDVPHNNDYYGSSENPFHPQGFGQYAGNYPCSNNRNYRHLGKLIPPESLPEQARKWFEQINRDYKEAQWNTKQST